jgi:hypothetical protein
LTFKLTIGAFTPVPSDTGLGTGCFFDFPAMPILLDRGRVATDDPTLQAVGGCAAPLRSSRLSQREYDAWTGLAARTPADTPKAVNVRLARETMEPRQTEFTSQGQYFCQEDGLDKKPLDAPKHPAGAP